MRKIVLDQFNAAWGYVEVSPATQTINVFTAMSGNTPMNVKTRKVSSNKKYEKELKRRGNYEVFVPCPINKLMFRY